MEEKKIRPHKKGKLKYSIEDMQAFAKAKGGKCLSTEYTGINNKLQWQCKEGHTWFSIPNQIINVNTWCHKCAAIKSGNNRRLTIEQMLLMAKERGGKCLSKIYIDNSSKLEWQCSEGHDWNATPSSIANGSWCPKCYYKRKGNIMRGDLKTYQDIALERNGKCLSTEYIHCNSKLQWQCNKGHVWMANPGAVKAGTWCPYCANKIKKTIEDIQVIAQKYGGKCLSTEYIRDKPLSWECAKGHVWKSTWRNVRKGYWCKVCKSEKKKAAKKLLLNP